MTDFRSISELLDELAPAAHDEERSWEDVLARAAALRAVSPSNGDAAELGTRAAAVGGGRRSRRWQPRRRLVLAALALLALAVVVVAAAYVLGHPVIDFGKAQKGPHKVVDDFGSLQIESPAGMAPGVLAHQARAITTVHLDGEQHTLYVAPTKKGGFCMEWSDLLGGCRADRHDKAARRIDVGGSGGPHGLTVLAGSFFQADSERLEVTYADGQTAEIPFVWLTAPISAGFYLYRVPDAHRRAGHQPVAVTLYDDSNDVIDREQLPGGQPRHVVMRRLPGYRPLPVPPDAVWAKRTQLFDWRAWDGARIGLWIAPERGGGSCFWTNRGGGCTVFAGHRAHGKMPPLGLGLEGSASYDVTLCCNVSEKIAHVEARFADGDKIELTPKRGYLVWPIPRRHYPLGHRLSRLVGYDAAGHAIATHRLPRDQRGVYPCARPKNLGYGVRMCP